LVLSDIEIFNEKGITMNISSILYLPLLLLTINMLVSKADEPVPAPVPLSIPAPVFEGERTKVPVAMRNYIPTIELTVNGKGPYHFVIDTGAMGYTIISERLAKELSLTQTDTILMGDPSGRNPIEVKRYSLSEIKLGDVIFKNLYAEAIPSSSGLPMIEEGILGLPFFSGHTLTIDYAKCELHLSSDPLPLSAETIFEYSAGFPICIPIMVGIRELKVHLDTGNGRGALIVSKKDAESLMTAGKPRNVGEGRTFSNTTSLFELRLASPVSFGRTALPIQEILYPSVTEVGNLGSPGLRGLILRIDQKNRRVQIMSPVQGMPSGQ